MPEPMSRPAPSGGGSTIAGIPTKYVLIGGGAAALGLFLFMRKTPGGAATSNDSDVTTGSQYGANLGPNASLALGSLENQLLQQSGILQDYSEKRFDSLQSTLDSQASQLSDSFGGVTDQLTHIYDYNRGEQQTILGLYQNVLFPQGYDPNNPTQVKAWADWVRAKFKDYDLGTGIPAGHFGQYDPIQP